MLSFLSVVHFVFNSCRSLVAVVFIFKKIYKSKWGWGLFWYILNLIFKSELSVSVSFCK